MTLFQIRDASMNKQEPSFFDSKTMMAIGLVIAIIFGWQAYLSKKYPQPNKLSETGTGSTTAQTAPEAKDKQDSKVFVENAEEKIITYESGPLNLEISSKGMGIKRADLNQYKDRKGDRVSIGNQNTESYLFETQVAGARLNFNLEKRENNVIAGVFKKGDFEIERIFTINPTKYFIDVETKYKNIPGDAVVFIPEKIIPHEGRGPLVPSGENQSVFVNHGNNSHERAIIDSKKTDNPFSKELSTVSVVSMGSLYFTSALVDYSEISPFFSTSIKTTTTDGELHLDTVTGKVIYRYSQGSEHTAKNKFYIGPKDVEILGAVDERLTQTVNFGWFSWISKPLLILMKFFYAIFKNYGVAIILMTIIIRLLMLPLMVSSYRSMKKMQTLQPLLLKIKEKHKENPQQMQIETMGLYKAQGVNPVAGCLPMFLQLPIFMALYSLLGHSIELYRAPFVFWIHDLSFKDPYYVLPVIMGIAMFVQQKITPSTMDPTQQKIFLFMPILFTFFMLSLPSGLTLYMVISSLFGIAQQHFFLNDKSKQTQSPIAAQSVSRDV